MIGAHEKVEYSCLHVIRRSGNVTVLETISLDHCIEGWSTCHVEHLTTIFNMTTLYSNHFYMVGHN